MGSYNPLIVAELFWEQSSPWQAKAEEYVEQISRTCRKFMDVLLEMKCPQDVRRKSLDALILDQLQTQYEGAIQELGQIMKDNRDFPSVFNHYYTDLRQQARAKRLHDPLRKSIKAAKRTYLHRGCGQDHSSSDVDIEAAARELQVWLERDMTSVSCEDALDDLEALYKERSKVFLANIVDQVIERHLIRGLDQIFSPVVVADLTDEEVLQIAAEPLAVRNQRESLQGRLQQLKGGQKIFLMALGGMRASVV